jgi:hypothetical protein
VALDRLRLAELLLRELLLVSLDSVTELALCVEPEAIEAVEAVLAVNPTVDRLLLLELCELSDSERLELDELDD